jgi:hypothetical protein
MHNRHVPVSLLSAALTMIPLCNRGMDLSRTKLRPGRPHFCTAGELFFGGEGRTGIPRNGKGPPTTALPKSSDMVLLVRGEVGRLSFRVDSGILKGGHVVTFPEQIGKTVSFPTSTGRFWCYIGCIIGGFCDQSDGPYTKHPPFSPSGPVF